jgi:hypothetical protein
LSWALKRLQEGPPAPSGAIDRAPLNKGRSFGRRGELIISDFWQIRLGKQLLSRMEQIRQSKRCARQNAMVNATLRMVVYLMIWSRSIQTAH